MTNALYDQISRENAALLLSALPAGSCTGEEIVSYVHRIDLAKARQRGLSPDNYPEAWAEGYRELAAAAAVPAREELAQRLRINAGKIHTMVQPDYPGAPELLAYLREQKCEVTIWTAGDRQVQMGKIERSGYVSLVDRVCIVPEKSVATLQEALAGRRPEQLCVIGNSPRADVAPALHIGAWAVHVRQSTWAYDEAPLDPAHLRYRQVFNLWEVPAVLADLSSAAAS